MNAPVEYKIDEGYLEGLLMQVGYFAEGSVRTDADDTQFLARQLEFVRNQTFDIKFPELKARMLIPVDNSVDSADNTVTYRQWEMFGAAAVISNYADDSPRVDTLVREFTGRVVSLGDSYGFSIQDLRASAKTGAMLETRKANSARRAMEQTVDQIAAFGDTAHNLPGFLNFANVPVFTLPNGDWTTATPQQIIQDLNEMVTSVRVVTKTVHAPDTMLLDTDHFDQLATTPIDPANGSNESILNVFLRNQPYIRNVDQWYRLDEANATQDGPRLMAYERNPDNMQLVIPQEFESFPPQARNLEFLINCHSRVGGIEWHYPLSAVYADTNDS